MLKDAILSGVLLMNERGSSENKRLIRFSVDAVKPSTFLGDSSLLSAFLQQKNKTLQCKYLTNNTVFKISVHKPWITLHNTDKWEHSL